MIFSTIVHNINYFSKYAELDLCGDKTTCGYGGHGESQSGILTRILNKPGIRKGMQIVILCNVHAVRSRAYLHRHDLHPMEEGFTKKGPNEVRLLIQQLDKLIIRDGEANINEDGLPRIFKEKPHMTFDNFFLDEVCENYVGKNQYKLICTKRRDRLPQGVPEKYFHKTKTTGCAR